MRKRRFKKKDAVWAFVFFEVAFVYLISLGENVRWIAGGRALQMEDLPNRSTYIRGAVLSLVAWIIFRQAGAYALSRIQGSTTSIPRALFRGIAAMIFAYLVAIFLPLLSVYGVLTLASTAKALVLGNLSLTETAIAAGLTLFASLQVLVVVAVFPVFSLSKFPQKGTRQTVVDRMKWGLVPSLAWFGLIGGTSSNFSWNFLVAAFCGLMAASEVRGAEASGYFGSL